MRQNLYVHLDGISNSVLTKGLDSKDFVRYTSQRPKNLLLLDSVETSGEYESHTGFRMVRGSHDVERYFQMVTSKKNSNIKWIDFEDVDSLKHLTANEIAEILYLAHMKTQLRSPFFYKLQNNYAFFEEKQSTTKIYYRHIEEFYRSLSHKITENVLEGLNTNRRFFSKKETEIKTIPWQFISNLKGIMQEGVIFDFSQTGLVSDCYHVPILVIEDNLRKIDTYSLKHEEHVGKIIYDHANLKWQLEI